MPVADQWKLREKTSVQPSSPAVATALPSGSKSPSADASSVAAPVLVKQGTSESNSSAASKSTRSDVDGPTSGNSVNSPSGRTAKNLAGFWSSQNDEVKVRKKRLIQVDDKSPADEFHVLPSTGHVERSPSSASATNAELPTPKDSETPPSEVGRTKNISSVFQQKQPTEWKQASKTCNASDRSSVISNESSVSKGHSSTSSATSSDALLNRKSEAIIVLAENQPIELGADVVRSEGSSWDDVAELESGRTKNLLAHWNKTEQEYAQPKTSTTRYQGGSKPAWILEIEAAKETSTGAIGSSWTAAENNGIEPTQVSVPPAKSEDVPEVATTVQRTEYETAEPKSVTPPEVFSLEQQSPEPDVSAVDAGDVTPPASCEMHHAAPPPSVADEEGCNEYSSERVFQEQPYFDFDPMSFTIDLMNGGASSSTSTNFGRSPDVSTQKHDDVIDEVFMPVSHDDWSHHLSALKAPAESSASISTTAAATDGSTSSIRYQDYELPSRDVTNGEHVALTVASTDNAPLLRSTSGCTSATPSVELSSATGHESATRYDYDNRQPRSGDVTSNDLDVERSRDAHLQTTYSGFSARVETDETLHGITRDVEDISTVDEALQQNHIGQERHLESAGKKRKEDKRKLPNGESSQSQRSRSWCLIL